MSTLPSVTAATRMLLVFNRSKAGDLFCCSTVSNYQGLGTLFLFLLLHAHTELHLQESCIFVWCEFFILRILNVVIRSKVKMVCLFLSSSIFLLLCLSISISLTNTMDLTHFLICNYLLVLSEMLRFIILLGAILMNK